MNIDDKVIFSIFMALEGLHAYSAFLPSVMTIGTFVDTPEKVRMIREGELVATGFLAVLVTTVGFMVKSWWPVVMGLLAGVVMLGVYEYALKNSPQKEQEAAYF